MSVRLFKHITETNLFNINLKRKRKDDNKARKSQNTLLQKKRS